MQPLDARHATLAFPVALDQHGVLERTAFWQRVHGLAAALARHPARRWALVCDDSTWFAAGLLALAQAGRTTVIPQAPKAGSLTASGARIDAILTDRPEAFAGFVTLAIEDIPPAADDSQRLPADTADIEFYTSGSSGVPKCVPQTFGQLRHEAETLEREWGTLLGKDLIIGTVPHYHRYGIQMRVMWPLLAGRSFVSRTCVQPAVLRLWAARQPCVIVSSPAFLTRVDDLAELPPAAQVTAVFSSGAPLPDACAERLACVWGHAPIEIYGSTETCGVAWRAWSGSAERRYWTPLNGVRVELRAEAAGTRLWVKSPFTWQAEWMATGDLAHERADGRFALLGRADDIVKLEDKRLSLSEMRTRLEAHAWVESARLLLLQGRRPLIGAVVILNAAGRTQLATQGRLGMRRELQVWLAQSYEPVLIPRKWRFPESLPDDDMGKIELSRLRRLFDERS
ncbi:MAG: AMP-binding protein [Gammaproteobacteria bacterium]